MPGGAFDHASQLYFQLRHGHLPKRPEREWVMDALVDSTMYYLTREAVAQLLHLYVTWPDEVQLEPEDSPTTSGLIVFEEPVWGIDSEQEGVDVRVDAILWSPVVLSDGEGVGIGLYSKASLDSASDETWHRVGGLINFTKPGAEQGNVEGDFFWPLGRTDWRWGTTVSNNGDVLDLTLVQSLEEDRRLLGSLWKLMTAAVFTENNEVVPRPARRRSEKSGLRNSSNVRVLTWNPPTRTRSRTEDEDHDVDVPRWASRWVVRGHFRSQPYGPGRTKRKVIFVDSFVKGPDNLPLRPTTKVFKIKPSR